jgi:hypothetical protein
MADHSLPAVALRHVDLLLALAIAAAVTVAIGVRERAAALRAARAFGHAEEPLAARSSAARWFAITFVAAYAVLYFCVGRGSKRWRRGGRKPPGGAGQSGGGDLGAADACSQFVPAIDPTVDSMMAMMDLGPAPF